MPEIEETLKLQNWLSVLTFDVVKYVAAGGEARVEWTADGLTLHLSGVQPDSNGVHGRFKREYAPVTEADDDANRLTAGEGE